MRRQRPGGPAVMLCLAGLLWLLLTASVWASPVLQVQSIESRVLSEQGLPVPVQQRMEKSVQAIAEQLLEGKQLAVLQQEQGQYEKIIQQVFDKVLVGYTVDKVELVPGEGTQVLVYLMPWEDRIQQVDVRVSVDGMNPELAELLYQDVAGIEDIFRQSLAELPVAATDWTHGLLKKQVNAFLLEHAPEFRADFDVNVAENTQVDVVLYPLLPVVRTVDLSMRSDNMLNAGLLLKRQLMQDRVDQLIGLPVPFVERHQQEIETFLSNILDQDRMLQDWDMHTMMDIVPGERLTAMCRTNSGLYSVRLEGWGDVGHKSDKDTGLMARLHIGRQLSSRDELFSRLDFYPQSVKWSWSLGYHYKNTPTGTGAGLLYDLHNKGMIFELQQDLAPRWQLRYTYRDYDNYKEYALRYKFHDFLSLEYVNDASNSWLRFIGYF